MKDGIPLVIAFGGGTNSTAMLCGFRERGIVPDLILFADTGSEMPETYEHVLEMDTQCRIWWGKGIETVRKLYQGEFEGLEKECLRGGKLPALAYGSRACSMKYKHEPQNRRLKAEMKERGVSVATRAIGFDAMESHRNRPSTDKWAVNWYPLMEWGWTRAHCIEAIKRHGLSQPGKSSCFFCPAMKRGEILRLKREHHDLFARALEIERLANSADGINKQKRGLSGRSLMWADIAAQDDAQGKLWDYLDEKDESPIPCGCYDG